MRSPTLRVGYIEVDGIYFGSANDDLNNTLTLNAVKAALASSEQKQRFINFESQLCLLLPFGRKTFKLLLPLLAITKASEHLSELLFSITPSVPELLHWVPPLSTSVLASSLHGSHFEPWRNWMIDEVLNGEIPKTPTLGTPVDCFIKEINPIASGDFVLSPTISRANVDVEEKDGAVLMGFDLELGKRKSE